MMIFKTPWILALIPPAVAWLLWVCRRQRQPGLRFPSTELVASLKQTWKIRLAFLPFVLRLLTMVLFLVALAGPRQVLEETFSHSEGIDIVLAIDASGSMAAEDFVIDGKRTNRLEVVKRVVSEFIRGRSHDRIGLVAFSALAYTVSPLTRDHSWLDKNLERVRLGLIKDGTAIGAAVSSSLSRLTRSRAQSKVIVLLTDGINNAGNIEPLEAARAAQALGIKIYTIGAGTQGYAPFPVTDFWGRKVYQQVRIDIDEEILKKIAALTGGRYFRATDTASLREIYKEIDQLEKTEIKEWGYKEYRELFAPVLTAALLILGLELLLSYTILHKVP